MPETRTPANAAELESMLQDDKFLKEVAGNPKDFAEFIQNYTESQMAKNSDRWTDEIRTQVQNTVGEMLRKNNASISVNAGFNSAKPDLSADFVASKGAAYNQNGLGVALDNEFKDLADYFGTVAPPGRATVEARARWDKIRNDYSTVTPDAGGFLVPEVLRATLLTRGLESSVVRQRATVVEMDAPAIPFPCVDETTHVNSVYGGISWAWVAEGASLPESNARFGRVVLRVNKLVSRADVPAELPMDSPIAFGNWINQAMPAAVAFGEDYGFLNGSGAGQPLGALNAQNTGMIEVAKETNQAADTVVWDNIIKMFSRMIPSSLPNAVWVAAIDTFPQLAQLALAVGTGGSAVWLNNGVEGPPASILGRPLIFTEKVPKLGDKSDISFVDFTQYLVGDMQQMRVQSSEHNKFDEDIIVYRVIERADGQPTVKSPITPANGSTSTLSPYVTLAERA